MALNDWNHSAPDADSWPEEYEDDGKLEGEELLMFQLANMGRIIKDAALTANLYTGVEFAPCARCHDYYRLVKVGKVWIQPDHDCFGELVTKEAMRGANE